ncbi:hypothetical protein [Nonomuraea sp. NPDC049625]|uniref:hypothetical protein n=1 Tax=Nonomuraea sp. NPDC049625 TaxID=3155775 RepID=UPI0034171B02
MFGLDANSQVFLIPAASPGLTHTLATTWLSKDLSPSPYVYTLVDRRGGGLPDDPTYHARQKELAKVTATYRASGAAATGSPQVSLYVGDSMVEFPISSVGDIALPGTLVHYRTPGLVYGSSLQVGTALTSDGGKLMKRGHTSEV